MTHQEELRLNKEQQEIKRFKLNLLLQEVRCTEAEIANLEQAGCNWVFETHYDAEYHIREYYENVAYQACEGSYNRGDDEYEQSYQLIASDFIYQGVFKVEYNRHDKQYYYIDGTSYEFTQVYPA